MAKRMVVVVAFCTLTIPGTLAAQQKPKIVPTVPAQTNPGDAPTMFREYCAACHGMEGKGNGPAAPALKTVPADLTKISARNGGKFPMAKVQRYIEGLDEISAHGSRDMPVWGQLLRGQLGGDAGVRLRVQNLANYLEKMQQ